VRSGSILSRHPVLASSARQVGQTRMMMHRLLAPSVLRARMQDALRHRATSAWRARSTAMSTRRRRAQSVQWVSPGRTGPVMPSARACCVKLAKLTSISTAPRSVSTVSSESMPPLAHPRAPAARCKVSLTMTVIPPHRAQTLISVSRRVPQARRTMTVTTAPRRRAPTAPLVSMRRAESSLSLDASLVKQGGQTWIKTLRRNALTVSQATMPRPVTLHSVKAAQKVDSAHLLAAPLLISANRASWESLLPMDLQGAPFVHPVLQMKTRTRQQRAQHVNLASMQDVAK
jgi:hypothetical protein